MVFPAKRRRCIAILGDGASSDGNQVSTTLHTRSQSQTKPVKLLQLSADQTKDFNFPVGCPVWYNFSQVPGKRGLGFSEGVVSSVNLDILSKSLVFNVERKNAKRASSIDTVLEDDIAYAANCPVVLLSSASSDTNEKKIDSQILVAHPMKGDNGNSAFSYVVRTTMEGSQALFSIEKGVMANRLRYRTTEGQPLPKEHLAAHDSKCPVIPMLSPDTSFQGNPEDHNCPSDIISDDGENDFQKKYTKIQKIPCKSKLPITLHGQSKLKRGAIIDDTHRLPYKRKTENVKKESGKKICCDQLHSSYENDGAI